jgi:hypothetical protein
LNTWLLLPGVLMPPFFGLAAFGAAAFRFGVSRAPLVADPA